MKKLVLNKTDRAAQLIDAMVETILAGLQAGIDDGGTASLVVSGGSTPRLLFESLSVQSFAWHKVSVTLADERFLPATDPHSNAYLVKNLLLQNEAAAAHFIPLCETEESAGLAARNASQRLKKLLPRYDVVILGMGEDGHTASLFPQLRSHLPAASNDSDQSCMAVEPLNAPYRRITQLPGRLLQTRRLLLHFTGERKWSVFCQALQRPAAYPVGLFMDQSQVTLEVFYAQHS